MYRILAIALITALVVVGALHYAPLWLFVPAMPIWAYLFLNAEKRRAQEELVERVRAHLLEPDVAAVAQRRPPSLRNQDDPKERTITHR
jgi:hypothetical protein